MIKVLLIEDNPQDTLSIKKVLASSEDNVFLDSFEFATATSLARALEILNQDKIDVVLLDLGLPDTRDFDGIEKIKKDFSLVPIIVLTKQKEETLVALEAVKRGAQDYFSKSHLSDYCSLDRVIRYAIERKKNEEEIILAREKADEATAEAMRASRAKSEFLASMSHDIRTPLNSIIGVADLLSRAKLSEDDANYVQMLGKASDNLLSLVNDVLDLSRIESGAVTIGKTEFDLLETVKSLLEVIAPRAHSKGLELILSVAPDLPYEMVGDPEHLGQVLANLVGNAIKFTKAGEVVVNVYGKDVNDRAATVVFQIQDSGIGIPPDKLSAIFESFTQLEQSDPSLKRQGSGLGLSICKRLVEMMGGTIEVRSEMGRGSVFQFELRMDLQSNQTVPAVPAVDLSKQDVLVTADNEKYAAVFGGLLQYWGAAVQTAHDSHEAQSLVDAMKHKGKKFQFAFVDLRMPGIATGGVELSQKIRDEVGQIVMMLPTNHRYGDMERLKKAGIDKYFFKPTKPSQIAEIIRGVAGGRPPAIVSVSGSEGVHEKILNLLVADDSEENRQLIEAYCKGSGFNLELAADGRQAFEKFKKRNFDMVLLDIQMPAMNGYEALSAIRAWEKSQKRARVPILALTAFALKEEEQRCLSAGFKAHVTKPIKRSDFIQTIKKHAA